MLIRTAKIRIEPRVEIFKTIELYKQGLQFCVNKAWDMRIKNNVKLHPFVYQDLKRIGLPSQLAVACIKQACGMVKRAKTKPEIKRVSIRYNFPRSVSMKNNVLSISTVNGRIKIPFKVPDCYKEYFKWEVRESLLRVNEKGRCFFLFTFTKDINIEVSNQHGFRVLGIDVGVNKLAVTSNGKFYGHSIKSLRKRWDKLVSELQSKGTRACKRKLKKMSGSWKRFMLWINHNISKEITRNLRKGDIVVMENLNGIRKSAKYNKWVHKWAFRQLQFFIEYKALSRGCRVVYVNSKYTSKKCNRCHSTKTVRHSGFFECLSCGHSLDADLNAARNIAQLYRGIWAG